MVTSQADCLQLGTVILTFHPGEKRVPLWLPACHGCEMSRCSCSQNTLKNKRLEHQSYRQERNFIDRERLSGETHSRVQKLGAP
jgi:hypothetical protein